MSPVYAPSTPTLPANGLNPGDSVLAWNAETLVSGSKSQAFGISPPRFGENTRFVAIELQFSAAPGAFTLDVQTADTDADANYVTVGAPVQATTVNAGQTARIEFQMTAKLVRLLMTTKPANTVTTTAKISR